MTAKQLRQMLKYKPLSKLARRLAEHMLRELIEERNGSRL